MGNIYCIIKYLEIPLSCLVSDSILEEGEGTETCKTERPTSIVTRRGEHVSLKQKERESERVSNLQDEDLFEGAWFNWGKCFCVNVVSTQN